MYSFTTEDLLQYLYNETSNEKSNAIQSAINTDWALREKMEILKASHDQLNQVPVLSPSNKTLENIFNYAEKAIEEVHEKA